MVRAAEMEDRYRDGALLRRWSLVAGWPRCVRAPLVVAETPPAEVAAAEAANAALRSLVAAAEAWEGAGMTGEPPPADVLALVAQRAREPRGPARILATAEGGIITALLVTDDPEATGIAVGPAARVGGALPAGTIPPLPQVPREVTNFQARAAMRQVILGDGRSLETAVREALWSAKQDAAALPESDPARIGADAAWLAWEQSNVFERDGALITGMAPAFGLSAADVDALFVAAEGIAA